MIIGHKYTALFFFIQAQNITFFSKTEQNYIEIRFQTDEWLSRFGLVMVEVRAIC